MKKTVICLKALSVENMLNQEALRNAFALKDKGDWFLIKLLSKMSCLQKQQRFLISSRVTDNVDS